ncbi:hypothetical protein [Brevibacillus marinus]|uniref:hypothetical protein n=1 Tax=Brevibacillus marinus TaxID=2496837 RepID=UPI000F824250|nr:hypothetical protein [Brevibacillus marinus]
MRIAMICTPVVYEKIKILLYQLLDTADLELSEPLPDFDRALDFLRLGVTGIILQEGNSASDIIKTMGIPYLVYEGQKDFGAELGRWLTSLKISFQAPKETHSKPNRYTPQLGMKKKEEDVSPAPTETPIDSSTAGKKKERASVKEAVETAMNIGQRSVEKILQRRRTNPDATKKELAQPIKEPLEMYTRNSFQQEIIVLYSGEPTGKTFVGVNLAIALARLGKSVHFMDITGRVKHWFNAPAFPFQLEDINLRVSGFERTSQAEILIVETSLVDVLSMLPAHTLFVVIDSDLAHQIEIAKAIHMLQPVGMIWNQENQFGDPSIHIHLPIVVTLPRYADTYERIEKGIPRALSDDVMCNELLKIYHFDPTDHFLKSRVVP